MQVIKRQNIIRPNYGAHNKAFYTADGMRFEFAPRDQNVGSDEFHLYESGVNLKRTESCNQSGGEDWTKPESSFLCNCGSYGLTNNSNNTKNPPCIITVDVNGDRKPNPKISSTHFPATYWANGDIMSEAYTVYNNSYNYPMPSDKKLSDIFNILITEEKAIPYGVVAQRAMYSK